MEKLKLTKTLKDIDDIQRKEYLNMENIGVLEGLSGLALFQFYYSELIDSEDNYDFGVKILERCTEKINDGYDMYSFSNGMSGFGWVLDHLEYYEFIDIDSDSVLSKIDDYLADLLESEVKRGHYDYLHGAIGIALYFLNRYSNTKKYNKKYENILILFLNNLTQISETIGLNKISWSNKVYSLDENVHNLSLSHGMAGIISFLVKTYKYECFRPVSKQLIEKSINYLLSFENSKKGYSLFPNWISKNSDSSSDHSRLGWCYGDMGIGLSIYNYSKASKNQILKKKALDILTHSSTRFNGESTMVFDAGMCHGSFGNFLMFHKIYQENKKENFDIARNFWLQDGMNKLFHKDGYAGYKKWNGTTRIWSPELCLLDGITGIGLSIIDFLSIKRNHWDECLMIT